MAKRLTVIWLKQPEAHDYPAALSYLQLLYADPTASRLVAKLRRARVTSFKAKDIFRASALPQLPLSNTHVKKDEKQILARVALSPLLLVRDADRGQVIVADGYHRLCAVYAFDEDAVVPCKIV
jgi:hypothetical protein